MAEWQNGGMAEWQKGGMAEWYFTTYLIYPAIFMVHTDDNDNDDNNTDTFKSFIVLKSLENQVYTHFKHENMIFSRKINEYSCNTPYLQHCTEKQNDLKTF